MLTEDQVLVLVTEEKWVKAKDYVQDLSVLIERKKVNCRKLQVIPGFLNYLLQHIP